MFNRKKYNQSKIGPSKSDLIFQVQGKIPRLTRRQSISLLIVNKNKLHIYKYKQTDYDSYVSSSAISDTKKLNTSKNPYLEDGEDGRR